MATKPKILIGLPTMGSLHTFLVVVILSWITEATKTGEYNLSIYPTMSVSPTDNARNEIVKIFMESDCTHLFFVDSDTVPPQDALVKLLRADQDIISAITPIIEHDDKRQNDSNGFYKKWNCVNQLDQFVEPNIGVVPIKGAGSSCIMIKRKVFEKLGKDPYRFLYKDDSGKDVQVGEDIHFIIKAIGAGFKPVADTSIICKHQKGILW